MTMLPLFAAFKRLISCILEEILDIPFQHLKRVFEGNLCPWGHLQNAAEWNVVE